MKVLIVVGIALLLATILICVYRQEFVVFRNDIRLLATYIRMNLPVVIPNRDQKVTGKVAIVSFDNRSSGSFIELHDQNMYEYCDKWGHEYIRESVKPENVSVYWYKVQMVYDALMTGMYDYVVWIDSDAIITDYSRDIFAILHSYNRDIVVGSDNTFFDVANAGVFAIANTQVGREFVKDWIETIRPYCYKGGDKLRGSWALSCYEQGTMNRLIHDKYIGNTATLPLNLIYNGYRTRQCEMEYSDEFIIHMYGQSDTVRESCFKKKMEKLKK